MLGQEKFKAWGRECSDRAFLHWIFGNEEEAPVLAELGYAVKDSKTGYELTKN